MNVARTPRTYPPGSGLPVGAPRRPLAWLLTAILITVHDQAAAGSDRASRPGARAGDAPQPVALSQRDAIRTAEDYARGQNIELEGFELPRAALVSAARGGKWRVFFVRGSHDMESCFSVLVFADLRPPRLRWCTRGKRATGSSAATDVAHASGFARGRN